jgi:hypothetical protein
MARRLRAGRSRAFRPVLLCADCPPVRGCRDAGVVCRLRGRRGRLGVPGRRARRVLADQRVAAPGCRRAGRLAGRGGGRPGQERGRDAAGHAARAARPGLSGGAERHRRRRPQFRRHRRGRRRARGRAATAGDHGDAASGRLGRQGVGHDPGTRRDQGRGLRAVHRRRHRLGGGHAAPPGGRGRGGRPGPGLPDGAAADGHRLGACRGAGLRLLLRPALPVPAGEPARLGHGRRGRRLHAGAPRRAGAGGRPGPDRRRAHRRRGHGPPDQAAAGPLLARPVPPGGQRAPVPRAGQPVADGGQVRLHPAGLFPGAARRDAGRPAVPVRAAPGRPDRRAGRRDRGRLGCLGRGCRGPGRLGADVRQLPAHAAAVPAVAAAGAGPAADRPAVRGDDRRLGAAALRRARRGMARPAGPGTVTLAA